MTAWPRVAFVAGTLGMGGAERQLWEQCRVLAEAGAPPVVLSLTRGEHWEGPLRDLGVEPTWVGRRSGRALRLAAIVHHLRRAEVDVVQASHGMANLYAAAAGKVLRRPSIGALRTTADRVVAAQGRLGVPALRWPDRLAGNARRNLDACRAYGVPATDLHYVPNAVDLDRFAPGGDLAEPFDVVFAGRLGPEKRLDVLVDAIALLRADGVEVTTAVVGDGPQAEVVRGRAGAEGVADLVRLVGPQARPERWYAAAKVAVLPSEREGTPNVLLEALACGTPVIGTPVGDVAAVVGDAGSVVPVGDAEALAAAIRRFVGDPAAREQAAVRARPHAVAIAGRPALEAAMWELYAAAVAEGASCAA